MTFKSVEPLKTEDILNEALAVSSSLEKLVNLMNACGAECAVSEETGEAVTFEDVAKAWSVLDTLIWNGDWHLYANLNEKI